MYCYLYDQWTDEKKYDDLRRAIETRIIDVGISGRIEKTTPLSSLSEQMITAVRQGCKTIVVVGDDASLVRAIDVAAFLPNISLGFIPLNTQSLYATVLGIPVGADACTVLSQRLTETVDVMQLGEHAAIGAAWWTTTQTMRILCDDRYTISVPPQHQVTIANIGNIFTGEPRLHSAVDHALHLTIQAIPERSSRWRRPAPLPLSSQVQCTRIEIDGNETASIVVDQTLTLASPLVVTIKPAALRLIVGRTRIAQLGS
jgi:diacylglycerol kinase family enzyme